jgi:hypothetical protein
VFRRISYGASAHTAGDDMISDVLLDCSDNAVAIDRWKNNSTANGSKRGAVSKNPEITKRVLVLFCMAKRAFHLPALKMWPGFLNPNVIWVCDIMADE